MKSPLVFLKILALIAVMGGGGVGIAACNTVEGAGEDVSAAGKGISRGARNVKKKM